MDGGSDPYLCEEDAIIFGVIVRRAAEQINCIATNQALRIAVTLKDDRRAIAIAIRSKTDLPDLLAQGFCRNTQYQPQTATEARGGATGVL
jgi:hypothetical protein